MKGAVAAGHPLTVRAGARVLEEGGNAVDACVAAAFAGMVTESFLTGLGAGGFMIVHRARDRSTRLADFYVSTPGLGLKRPRGGEMQAIDVGFGDDAPTRQPFLIGPATVAVPGAVAGLEAVHRRYGRMPWQELLAPATELARDGIEVTTQQAEIHAMLDPIIRFSHEARRIYSSPQGAVLVAGDRLRLPDLADSFAAIARRGAAAIYGGERARAIVATVRDGGGELTLDDLAAFRVVWRRPVRVQFEAHDVLSNPPPSAGGVLIAYGLALLARLPSRTAGSAAAIAALAEVMREQSRARGGGFSRDLHRGGAATRLLAPDSLRGAKRRIERHLAGAPDPAANGTTHISVIDGDGNAAGLSASTGSGSGVVVPGTGIYLNNMLGEYDLVGGRTRRPARRLTSMMAPTIALTPEGRPRLVVGSAGSARLRGAIMQIVVNVLQHGLGVADAVNAPRIYVDEPHVHCEGGHEPPELDRLDELGYDLVRWRDRNLFFGGAAAVEVLPDGSAAAAGDPRRGGAGILVGES
jgi:gamma-glutamyltranspeptidase/glutathione hydrolase